MLKEQRTQAMSEGAEALGVSTSWLRFGERLGVLSITRRKPSSWRYDTEEDVERLYRLGVGERKRYSAERCG